MNILGIETSCDDTSVALLEASEEGFSILKELTASQVEVHKKYGGVVPEIAAREHAEAIMPVIEAVMAEQGTPDVIAVTAGPGLITSLLVGTEAAKALSYLWEIPLVAVNHIEGHIHSVLLSELRMTNDELRKIEFPALCLVVSGGHTELILMRDHGAYERIGATRDDAAGECFDKVAKLVGFDYPGGPKISASAEDGNPAAIEFPRPMLQEENYNFSFAGLKTSALYWLRNHEEFRIKNQESRITINDFCASFEQAIIDALVAKTVRAAKQYAPKSNVLAGGVAANKKLRKTLQHSIQSLIPNSLFIIPRQQYCMDNGAMIAAAGYYKAKKKEYTHWRNVQANPNWNL